MVRIISCLIAATCSCAVALGNELPNGTPPNLKVKAQELFKQADEDQNGKLDQKELAEGNSLAEQMIESLIKDRTIHHSKPPIPTIPEPVLANKKTMTAAEFTVHFASIASQKDAHLRTIAKARRLPPIIQIATQQPSMPVKIINPRPGAVNQPMTNTVPLPFVGGNQQTQQDGFGVPQQMGVPFVPSPVHQVPVFEHPSVRAERFDGRHQERHEEKHEKQREEKHESKHEEKHGHRHEGK